MISFLLQGLIAAWLIGMVLFWGTVITLIVYLALEWTTERFL